MSISFGKTTFFFRSGGAPGLLREYPGLLRSEKSMKKGQIMLKKNLLQKADKNPILRGSKVPCLKPRKPMPDPKNQKNEKINLLINFRRAGRPMW